MHIIYFDSSTLIAAGWPRPSTEFAQLLALARLQSVTAALPAPVEQELEEHWLRDIENTGKGAAAKVANFNRQTRDVVPAIAIQLPDAIELREKYRSTVNSVKQIHSLIPTPMSERPLRAVYEMALKLTPPFEEKGVGFKDSVILLSVLDHLEASADKQGALITQDRLFGNAPLMELSPAAGGRLRVFKELKEVHEILLMNMAAVYFEKWQEDRRNIKSILESKLAELNEFIATNLEIHRFNLPPNVISVSEIDISGIIEEEIQAPIPRPENGMEVPISFELKVHLRVLVEKYPETETKPFKIGEIPKRGGLIDFVGPQQVEEIEIRVVRVEALAFFNNGYQSVRFVSASIKNLGFGFGQGLLGLGSGAT